MQLAGWDGPTLIEGGVHRYSKTRGWIRLYIYIDGQEFHGGVTGTNKDFKVALDAGEWKRFDTILACYPDGEVILRLIDCTTLDLVIGRMGVGVPIEDSIETIEDLAEYLENTVSHLVP